MPRVTRSMKIAAAGGVATVAAGLGASAAMADTSAPTPSATSTAAPSQPSGETARGPGGPGGRHGGPGGMDATALADKLGLTEAKVSAALEKVREAQRPPSPPAEGTKPSEADRAAREKATVTALAKELGVSEAKVQAALDAVRADHQASRRSDLVGRLDAAVKAGTLSAADKASVLKAFDAGVLGGSRP